MRTTNLTFREETNFAEGISGMIIKSLTFGRSDTADPDPVLAFLFPAEVLTGLGLFLRLFPRSESLALLSLKMAWGEI